MNKDQVKGTAKDIAGKIQEGAGELTGDREQEARAWRNRSREKPKRRSVTQKKLSKTRSTIFNSRTVIPSNPLRRVFLG